MQCRSISVEWGTIYCLFWSLLMLYCSKSLLFYQCIQGYSISSIKFSLSCFMLMYLIHLVKSSCRRDTCGSIESLLYEVIQFDQNHLLKSLSFSSEYLLHLYIKLSSQVSIDVWVFNLIHWCMGQVFCQYHCVFMTISL